MTRPRILKENETYTFCRYYELKYAAADILHELGTSLKKEEMKLPTSSQSTRLEDLRERIRQGIACVSLTSEAARREVLIAPTLLEVARVTKSTIDIEYSIEVSQYLKGDLDYYLRSRSGSKRASQYSMLIVEAKQADLTRGFTQLAVELIALDGWIESDETILYGAVTTGDIWQFGSFERLTRTVTQDLMLYRVPTDLELLLPILIGILTQTAI